jgi:hypothetical protein
MIDNIEYEKCSMDKVKKIYRKIEYVLYRIENIFKYWFREWVVDSVIAVPGLLGIRVLWMCAFKYIVADM